MAKIVLTNKDFERIKDSAIAAWKEDLNPAIEPMNQQVALIIQAFVKHINREQGFKLDLELPTRQFHDPLEEF